MLKEYVFDNAEGFEFNESTVEFVGGVAKLKIGQSEDTYTESFSSATGFTYDSSLSEFVGGVLRQIDKRPTDATLGMSYSSSVNPSWATTGTLVGTANNGAQVTAGRLDLSGGAANKSVTYDGTGRIGIQKGAIKFKWTPNYNGTPTDAQYFFEIAESEGSPNSRITLFHHTNGALFLLMNDKDGVNQVSNSILTFMAVSGTESEVEVNWDMDLEKVYVFGAGFLIADIDTTFDRSACAYFRVGGSDGNTDSFFDDVITFSSLQHSANYSAGYSVPNAAFVASSATLPEMAYNAGDGTFLEVTDFTTTESNEPHYSIQIGRSGDYLYWNGSAWVSSDGTYDQANDSDTFQSNVGSLDVDEELYVQMKIHFSTSNVQQSVDEVNLEIRESTIYTMSPQKIIPIGRFQAAKLISFLESATLPPDTHVKYTLEVDSVEKYWDGIRWNTSSGTYPHSNTAEDVENNIVKLIDTSSYLKLIVFLKTDDESVSPSLSSATLEYQADLGGVRGYLDNILSFIGTSSLTDTEFDSISLESVEDDLEVYQILLIILQTRESQSDTLSRLEDYFKAKGAAVSTSQKPLSNIFVGERLVKVNFKLDKRFQSLAKGTLEKYNFQVGVLKDSTHYLPVPKSRSNYAGGPVRETSRKKSHLNVSDVSERLRKSLGINFYTRPFERKGRNKEIVDFLKGYFDLCLGRTTKRRVENLLQAVVRNPILRRDYGHNTKATIKAKGFDRLMIDTAQLFKSITAKVETKNVSR